MRERTRGVAIRSLVTLCGVVLLAQLVACGGAQSGSGPTVADEQGPAGQAVMPRQAREPDALFADANRAFQQGEVAEAPRYLGEILIVAPNWNTSVVNQGMDDTCSRLGQDCGLVRERLSFISDAWFGRHGGPRGGWVPQQEEAYQRIVRCYDHLIVGDHSAAISAGGPVTGAPLPVYASAAQRCVGQAESVLRERERRERADAALQEWHANYPCMDAYRRELLLAYGDEDWETFVDTYPQFEACARPIQGIIDDGILEGDNRLGLQHDLAFTHLSEVEMILEDYRGEIERTRRGLVEIQSDPGYAGRINEIAAVDGQLRQMDAQINSLGAALQAVTGPEAQQLEGSLRSLEQARGALAGRRDQLVDELNQIRQRAGLPPRDF